MSDSKNFNLNNISDCVELLTLILEKSNTKGIYTLQESAWAFTCLNNIKQYIKQQQQTPPMQSKDSIPYPSLLPPLGLNNSSIVNV